MFWKTQYQYLLALPKEDAIDRFEQSAEFANQLIHGAAVGAVHSREQSNVTFRMKMEDDYYKLVDALLVAAHIRFFKVDDAHTRLDMKFYYTTTPLSVLVVLVKIVLAIALLGGLSLVLPQLDAVYDEYIPYFREHGQVYAAVIGTLTLALVAKTALLFQSVRDMKKAVFRIYGLGEK